MESLVSKRFWDLECVAVEISRSYRMFFNFLISLLHMNEGGAGNLISYDTLSENTCEIKYRCCCFDQQMCKKFCAEIRSDTSFKHGWVRKLDGFCISNKPEICQSSRLCYAVNMWRKYSDGNLNMSILVPPPELS